MDPYRTQIERKNRAHEFAARLENELGRPLSPGRSDGKRIARSFWGQRWVRNIDAYQDYATRLPLGRTALRAGEILDLTLAPHGIEAYAAGEELHHVRIRIRAMEDDGLLARIRVLCASEITSLVDFLRGNLSDPLIRLVSDPEHGIFPQPHEIEFDCDCFDDSILCRHAAAALYGAGPRFDTDPALFFTLRGISPDSFFQTGTTATLPFDVLPGNALSENELAETFGIDFDSFSDID